MISASVPRYGVREQTQSGADVDQATEALRLVGFAVVDGGYTEAQQDGFAAAFDRAHRKLIESHGGAAALADIGEHDTIRAPLAIEDEFFELAQNSKVTAICQNLFGGQFILNQQNGLINPANGKPYGQGSYHRDLPYQHFVSSRPLAINALYCLDPFTRDNGATRVVPASHKEERFPSDETVGALEKTIEAPRGHFLLMDCMTYHSGGVNVTARPRRAVNHLYSLPFVRQPIELPALLGKDRKFSPALAGLLNYGNPTARSLDDYYQGRKDRLRPRPS